MINDILKRLSPCPESEQEALEFLLNEDLSSKTTSEEAKAIEEFAAQNWRPNPKSVYKHRVVVAKAWERLARSNGQIDCGLLQLKAAYTWVYAAKNAKLWPTAEIKCRMHAYISFCDAFECPTTQRNPKVRDNIKKSMESEVGYIVELLKQKGINRGEIYFNTETYGHKTNACSHV